MQCHGIYIKVRKDQLHVWKGHFKELLTKILRIEYVSSGVILEGLGVQMLPRRPAG